jgi:uncharacterized protein (DUF2384 family)
VPHGIANFVSKKLLSVEHLAWIHSIFKQAVELFENEAEAIHWLITPKSALDGELPLNSLKAEAGAKKVE